MFCRIGLVLGSIALCSALLFCKTPEERNPEMKVLEDVPQCSISACAPYSKLFFINGVQVTDDSALLTRDGSLYVRAETLQQMISAAFFSIGEDALSIRHTVLDPDAALSVDGTLYLSLDRLAPQYLRLNRTSFEGSGDVFLDTLVPDSLFYDHNNYRCTSERCAVSDLTKKPTETLESGRYLWKKGRDLWIEDDFGNAYRYTPVEYSLNSSALC